MHSYQAYCLVEIDIHRIIKRFCLIKENRFIYFQQEQYIPLNHPAY